MSRHPSEFFVKYLLTLPDTSGELDWVNAQLKRMGLPRMEVEDYENLLGRFATFPGFNPRRPDHARSMVFLRKEKIHGLHYPDKSTTLCRFILGHVGVRDMVETLLLGTHTPAVIARTVNRKFDKSLVTAAAVDCYRHYFWNTDLLTRDEWAWRLHGQKGTPGRRAALLGGRDVAMFKVGVQRQIESREILQRIQMGLYQSWLEIEPQATGMDKVEMQCNIANAMTRVDERLSQSDIAMQEVLERFDRFRMASDPTPTPSVDELTGGEFNEPGRKLLEDGR